MAASKQTLRNQRYQDKAGWISKSYKMKREVVEAFAEACELSGVSQAGQLSRMMKEYVEQVKRQKNNE
ncbi:hypothetical protein IMSAGC018_01897 [Lachnospiraceae bacterium]|nr:hypothetical protein IMSAGC018_01897 [Lachnospiraceae bacterium]